MAKVNFSRLPVCNRPLVWTIAGSDSGGGAGIQADLASMQNLETHGCSVITAVTAQSSLTVAAVEAVSDEMLLAQLDTLAADLIPKAIKVGLLASQEQINIVASWLANKLSRWQADNISIPVILDPVMVATCGDALTKKGEQLDFSPFKGLLTLITPNVSELAILAGRPLSTADDSIKAATSIAVLLATSVLAKGGDKGPHWDQDHARDLLVCHQVIGISSVHKDQTFWLTSPRVATNNSHGTGCTLSSAIAAVMAHGFVLNDAVVVAKAYVSQGLLHSYQPGSGGGCLARCGWPNDLASYPIIEQLDSLLNVSQPHNNSKRVYTFKKISEPLGVYPVVADIDLLQELLYAGASTIQLRVKDGSDPLLEQKIIKAIELGRDYSAKVFINDHWQLAIKHQAYGVHLGQEDLSVSNLKQLNAANIALGLSSHSYFEILLAMQYRPSYIAFGHIFPTTTKQMPSAPQGLNKLVRYVELVQGILPLVAIGGIDACNLAGVKASGVDDVAVVRAVTEVDDPAKAYQTLVSEWTLGVSHGVV